MTLQLDLESLDSHNPFHMFQCQQCHYPFLNLFLQARVLLGHYVAFSCPLLLGFHYHHHPGEIKGITGSDKIHGPYHEKTTKIYRSSIPRRIYQLLLLGASVKKRISSLPRQFPLLRKHPILKGKYRKNSKIWDTSNNCHNCLKNRKVCCNFALNASKRC